MRRHISEKKRLWYVLTCLAALLLMLVTVQHAHKRQLDEAFAPSLEKSLVRSGIRAP